MPQYIIMHLINQSKSKEDKATEKVINVAPKTVAEIILNISKV